MSVVVTSAFPSVAAAVAKVAQGHLPSARLEQSERFDRDSFLAFCLEYPDVEAELLPDGTIAFVSPQVAESNESENVVATLFTSWWLAAGRPGKAYGPTIGLTLPDGSVRSPDVCWISPERIAALPKSEFSRFPRVVPNFVVEVISKSDRLKKAREKMRSVWMAHGVELGWLIVPKRRCVYVYRAGAKKPEKLEGFERVVRGERGIESFELDLRVLT